MADGQAPPPPSSNIAVVLHRTEVSGNLGSVARVMGNTGFSRLILSDPQVTDLEPARRMAVSALPLLEAAVRAPDLPSALAAAGAEFVVGTTGRDRRYWDALGPREAAPLILAQAAARPVALLFGPEPSGLTNEELDRCQMILTLPTGGPVTSYNLSHAVLLVLFALMEEEKKNDGGTGRRADGERENPLASRAELDGMYDHLQELLLASNFLWPDNPGHMMRMVRSFMERAKPLPAEVKAIRGVCRNLLHHLRKRKDGGGAED